MNQQDQILQHLKTGKSITPIEALTRFGCMRLSGRIYDLRKEGHEIESDRIETPNGARVARYRLA